MFSEKQGNVLHGILLIVLFSFSAFYIAEFQFIKNLSLSPLIVGIILGMLYANSLRNRLPETWVPGIKFCSKQVLRAGIVLYGFRLTFQSVIAIGASAILIDVIIVTCTILLGILVGKLLKMDNDLALLTATGSAICGAAAVLGAEPVLLIMSFALARRAVKAVKGDKNTTATQRGKITIPWFAFGFLAIIGFNSFDWLPVPVVDGINSLDTFMLTMAMTALGAETNFEKFKQAGAKPFLLAAILYIWLLGGGYLLVKWLA